MPVVPKAVRKRTAGTCYMGLACACSHLNISSLAPALEWPVRPPRLGSWPAHSLAVWAEALGAPWQVEQASA